MKSPKIKTQLIAEFLEKEVTMNALAAKYGINRNTVRVWLNEKGLTNRHFKQARLDKPEIIRLYVEERKSAEEIAPLYGVSVRPIRYLLRKAGVQRTQPETMMGKWVGAKNPNWKGGRMNRDDLRERIAHYERKMVIFSRVVKARDNHTCKMCGSKEKIESNHIIPVRDIKDEAILFDINNGITLCRRCHLSIHLHEYEYVETFRKLLQIA